jgi:hypothetical protein
MIFRNFVLAISLLINPLITYAANSLEETLLCLQARSSNASAPLRLPPSLGFREVETKAGHQKVSLIDGYRMVLFDKKNGYAANVKLDLSDPQKKDTDIKNIIDNLQFIYSKKNEKMILSKKSNSQFEILTLEPDEDPIVGLSVMQTFIDASQGKILTIYFSTRNFEGRKQGKFYDFRENISAISEKCM